MAKLKANMNVNCSICVYNNVDGRRCGSSKGRYFGTVSQIYCPVYKPRKRERIKK